MILRKTARRKTVGKEYLIKAGFEGF